MAGVLAAPDAPDEISIYVDPPIMVCGAEYDCDCDCTTYTDGGLTYTVDGATKYGYGFTKTNGRGNARTNP
jgi:hypothetical protein